MSIKEKRAKALTRSGKKARIAIGIHASEGGEIHDDATFEADGALTPGAALTVAEIGAFHEFGTRTIPQRSFIRGWFDGAIQENKALVQSQLALVVAGRLTLEQALERVALKCEANVKRRIRDRIPPPLKTETIKRKGSSVPLINTGQLRAAIRGKAEVL